MNVKEISKIKPMKYKYETHLHTKHISKCAHSDVRENLEFYKKKGFDGVFITNHFLDGNINVDKTLPYAEQVEFYFSDYEKALELSSEIGIKVFCGAELSYKGTDFLIYGLDKMWYLENPQIMEMEKSKELEFMRDSGALVIQAHPFRMATYIDHIRIYTNSIHGMEVINANRSERENDMALYYATSYGLLMTAGSDNHMGKEQKKVAGMSFDTPLRDENDFIERVKKGEQVIFYEELDK